MPRLRARRPIFALVLMAGLLSGLLAPGAARAQSAQQALVDRATLTVQDVFGGDNGNNDAANLLRRARGVMICPRLFKASFFFGGQGGGCVLLGRDGAGSWSAPAFYSLGSGSFGLQIGIQDSELVMIILTEKGLNAVMDSQFKFGADASVAIATIGAGIEGATTTAVGADIVAFSRARGLFAGVSLSGTSLATDTDWNRAYYGQALAARQIVVQMSANNPGADPLRAALMRYGTPGAPAPLAPASAGLGAPDAAAAPPGSVRSAPLPPAR